MCLLVFGRNAHPEYPLIFGGNRDEFYGRPTAPATFWDDAPHVLAGRDEKEGGTWMGVTRNGHWGVVTNVREPGEYRPDARSRGHLVADYLRDEPSPQAYLEAVRADADAYNGFNLLVGIPGALFCLSTAGDPPVVRSVADGVHGLSNAQLDTPWPKVVHARRRLHSLLEGGTVGPDPILDLLDDRTPFPDADLPDTGIGREAERQLSPIFIDGERYGTRSSTVLCIDRTGTVTFVERTFDRGRPQRTRRYRFDVGTVERPTS